MEATSSVGYKHTKKAKQKMVDRFKKVKHPLLGKHHTDITKHKISLATKGEKKILCLVKNIGINLKS